MLHMYTINHFIRSGQLIDWQAEGQTDGWREERDGWMDGRNERQMDGRIDINIL